jgi:predicted aspartyl protease
MAIYLKGKIKGKTGEYEGLFFINTGADVILIPKQIGEEIKPKFVGRGELLLADGSKVKRDLYEVELIDSEGKIKNCKALATLEKREDVVTSFETLKKVGAVIDVKEEKIEFKP